MIMERKGPNMHSKISCSVIVMCFIVMITTCLLYLHTEPLFLTNSPRPLVIHIAMVPREQDSTTDHELSVISNYSELSFTSQETLSQVESADVDHTSDPIVLKNYPSLMGSKTLSQERKSHNKSLTLNTYWKSYFSNLLLQEEEGNSEQSALSTSQKPPYFGREVRPSQARKGTEPTVLNDNDLKLHPFGRETLSLEQETHMQPKVQNLKNYQLFSKPSTTLGMSQEQDVGYMLALVFSDQGTGSFINILSFLCFASELGRVSIVEPFLVGSVFGQFLHDRWAQDTTFSDVFDSNVFNHFVLSKKFTPLVSYDTFLKNAPRKLLVAQYQCSGSRCRSCGHKDVLEKGQIFCKLNGFEMVGHVCLNYGPSGKLTYKEIEDELYATYNRSEVVILLIRYGGVSGGRFSDKSGYRLFIHSSSCYRSRFFVFSKMRPSQLVTTSAINYINKYLDGKPYVSVMVRIQALLGSNENVKSERAPNVTRNCLSRLYTRLQEIKVNFGISNIFLCLDVGDYGSNIFRDETFMNPLLPHFDEFVSQTIKEGMTLFEWDKTFSTVTLRQEPGFVAAMQKVIAARGDVLVLLGGSSSFQTSTLEMYKSLHRRKKVLNLSRICGI